LKGQARLRGTCRWVPQKTTPKEGNFTKRGRKSCGFENWEGGKDVWGGRGEESHMWAGKREGVKERGGGGTANRKTGETGGGGCRGQVRSCRRRKWLNQNVEESKETGAVSG